MYEPAHWDAKADELYEKWKTGFEREQVKWRSVDDPPEPKTAVWVCGEGRVCKGYLRGMDEGWFTWATGKAIEAIKWAPIEEEEDG